MTDPDPDDPVTAIRNIGPAQAADLARAGITTARALRETGAEAAYRAMLAAGAKPHFIAFYSLHMALQGRPWNDCRGAEKAALRARFDAIKGDLAASPHRSELEKFLDEIGAGPRR